MPLTKQQRDELRELPPMPQDGCDYWCVATEEESIIAEVFDSYDFQPLSSEQGFAKHNAAFIAAAHNAFPALNRDAG